MQMQMQGELMVKEGWCWTMMMMTTMTLLTTACVVSMSPYLHVDPMHESIGNPGGIVSVPPRDSSHAAGP